MAHFRQHDSRRQHRTLKLSCTWLVGNTRVQRHDERQKNPLCPPNRQVSASTPGWTHRATSTARPGLASSGAMEIVQGHHPASAPLTDPVSPVGGDGQSLPGNMEGARCLRRLWPAHRGLPHDAPVPRHALPPAWRLPHAACSPRCIVGGAPPRGMTAVHTSS